MIKEKGPADILKSYWGFGHFYPLQEEVINAVLKGNDALVLMPTGGGKSLCYQVPAMLNEGLTLVITPLVSLMIDQVAALRAKNIKAVAVHSGLDNREIDYLFDSCIYGDIKLLYCSPERISTPLFLDRVQKMNIQLVAVDEAHCISQWGHDFRPSYLSIHTIRPLVRGIPMIAMTATATPKVQKEIKQYLHLENPQIFKQSFARKNLSLSIRHVEHKEQKLLEILEKIEGSSIVYVRSRRKAREISHFLTDNNVSATFYHAGLSSDYRLERQGDWKKGKYRVMVATNAFGMGIDKANVRTVIHYDVPTSPEAYYQEAGRAGRDGRMSYAVLLLHNADEEQLNKRLQLAHPKASYIKHIYQCLANYYGLATGSGYMATFQFDINNFSNRYSLKSVEVFHGIKRLEENALIQLNDIAYEPSKLKIIIRNTDLYKFQVANARFDQFIKAILRLYGGQLYSEYTMISESRIAEFAGITIKKVNRLLSKLNEIDIVTYFRQTDKPTLTFTKERQDLERLVLDTKRMKMLRSSDENRARAMIGYFQHRGTCRMAYLLEYFGEKCEVCGICDTCLDKKNTVDLKGMKEAIEQLLAKEALSIKSITEKLGRYSDKEVIDCCRKMLDSGLIILKQNDELELFR